MFEVELKDPWFLALIVFAPLVYWVSARARSTVRFSSLELLSETPHSLRSRVSQLPSVLLGLSVVLLAIALARPRTPDALTRVHREGVAIMMVVDRSGSMNARDLVKDDFSVDRLSVVKDVFKQFVVGDGDSNAGRPDDMVGLISFGGYADSICPLTLDHGNLALMVDELEIVTDRSEDGTAIGDALALSVERLRKSQAKSRVAILLTDGENNAGVITPKQASELAAAHEIKVYCIGAGTNGIAPVPAIDPFSGRTRLVGRQVSIDEKTLKEIAQQTGGEYFRATDVESLSQVYEQINQLETTKISEVRYLRYTEHYQAWVIALICCVGVASFTSATLFRKLP